MIKLKPYLLFLFTIPVIIFTLYSCATKPNIPYPGRMSEIFAKLEQWNPLLAKEIRKLPEFQDGVLIQEEKALNDLFELYADNPKVFNTAFKQMYQVGIPKVRKYCSPLQALFWLAEDSRNKEINEILKSYSLALLLEKAWAKNKSTDTEPYIKELQLTEEEAQSIINKMSKEKQKFYEGMSNKTINDVMLIQYKENPRYFPREIRNTIKLSLKEKPNTNYKNYLRWKNFNIVADRLNAPEVIHFYINNNFRYQYGDFPPAYTTFKRKFGNCTALADFGKFLLERAGYKTFVRSVDFSGPSCTSEHQGSGIVLGNNKYQLVVDFSSAGNRMIREPIDLESLDNALSYGHKIIGRRWGHRNNSCDFYD